MSKTKPSAAKRQNNIIYLNIRSRCALFGFLSEEASSKKIGMAISTFNDRKNKGNWKSDELVYAAEALKVSTAWIMTDHSKEEVR